MHIYLQVKIYSSLFHFIWFKEVISNSLDAMQANAIFCASAIHNIKSIKRYSSVMAFKIPLLCVYGLSICIL